MTGAGIRPGLAALVALAAGALAAGAGCNSKPSGKQDESAAAGAAAASHGAPAHGEEDSALPQAVPVIPLGTLEPAPWLEGARRVAAVAVPTPEGKPRTRDIPRLILSAGPGWIKAHRPDGTEVASAEATGQAQLIEIVDVNGDGRREIAVGHGFGRDALDVKPSLRIFPIPEEGKPWRPSEEIPLPPTTRPQIVGVASELGRPGELYIGMFESKYQVYILSAVRAVDGTWTVTTRDTIRVALGLDVTDIDADGKGDLVIARPYGESVDAPGDVFVLGPDNARTPLPSTRGARAIATWRGAVIFADGWHKSYGHKARALITRVWREDGKWRSQILVRVQNRIGYDRLRIGDINGDSRADILAAGNGPAVAVLGMDPVEHGIPALGTGDAVDVFPIDLDGDRREEVIVAGPTPGIWRLAPPSDPASDSAKGKPAGGPAAPGAPDPGAAGGKAGTPRERAPGKTAPGAPATPPE